jgi:hypothetical protein
LGASIRKNQIAILNPLKMAKQESSPNKIVRFPVGLVNQIAALLGAIFFVFAISTLFDQLFSGYRFSFRQPTQYDIVSKVLSLGFLLALFTLSYVRNGFRLLWCALLGFTIASLIGKTAFYVSENFLHTWEFFYSISHLIAATLFCFALFKGERLDKFFVGATTGLLAKLLNAESKEQVKKHE